jgi:hypothetical protein
MNDYTTIKVCGKLHVIRDIQRPTVTYRNGVRIITPEPDYMNTGKALCGILKKGQTLDEWIKSKAK